MRERIPLPIWILLLAFVGCQTQKMTADESLLNSQQITQIEMPSCPKALGLFKKMKDEAGETLICANKKKHYLRNVMVLHKISGEKNYHLIEKKNAAASFQFLQLSAKRFALTQVMFVPVENKFYHVFPLETSIYNDGYPEANELCPNRWPKGIYTGTADYIRKNHSLIRANEQSRYAKKLFAESLDGSWKARRILLNYADWFSISAEGKQSFEFYKNLFVQLEEKKCLSYQKLSFPFAI